MKKRFDKIKRGEYFKYYSTVYRKYDYHDAIQLTGKSCFRRFFCNLDNVIPVTVIIN
jgi:hypothetical protein